MTRALDPHVHRLLAMLSTLEAAAVADDPNERRRSYAQLMEMARPATTVDCDALELSAPGPGGEIALRLYTPPSARSTTSPGMVYLHGGGWVAGSLDTHDCVARGLAAASGCRVISVDYRLAPEHRHPAQLADAEAATRWVVDHAWALRIDPRRLAIAGDSAGANLAAALCHVFLGQGEAPFALQLLLCPFLDLAGDTPSRREFGKGYFMDLDAMRRDLDACVPASAALTDPLLSPLRFAQFRGLPPAHIHSAEFDPMRDESRDYALRLASAGVETRYVCHPGMIHQFYAMGGLIPAATKALAEIGAAAGAAEAFLLSGCTA